MFSKAPITGVVSQMLASVVQNVPWYDPEPYLTDLAIASNLVGNAFIAVT